MRAELLVLAVGPGGGAAVDLRTGALVRVHWIDGLHEPLSPFDLVEADLRRDPDAVPFPNDTFLAAGARKTGRLSGRRAERLLKPLVHPDNRPLLGTPTAEVAYWTLRHDQPSIALVAPTAGPVVERDNRLRLRCRFRWRRLDHDLPLDDPFVDERLSHPTAMHLSGGTLARALGWRPQRLVVALTPPRHGQCRKVVAGLLPKP
ncbi:MAG TPA: hypothetical protein VM345_16495 [Acidimicrobiales bacterium]|nr:hypothetical protein [Acidimicrobiales bacterium]